MLEYFNSLFQENSNSPLQQLQREMSDLYFDFKNAWDAGRARELYLAKDKVPPAWDLLCATQSLAELASRQDLQYVLYRKKETAPALGIHDADQMREYLKGFGFDYSMYESHIGRILGQYNSPTRFYGHDASPQVAYQAIVGVLQQKFSQRSWLTPDSKLTLRRRSTYAARITPTIALEVHYTATYGDKPQPENFDGLFTLKAVVYDTPTQDFARMENLKKKILPESLWLIQCGYCKVPVEGHIEQTGHIMVNKGEQCGCPARQWEVAVIPISQS